MDFLKLVKSRYSVQMGSQILADAAAQASGSRVYGPLRQSGTRLEDYVISANITARKP
jgi:hypothetical protein